VNRGDAGKVEYFATAVFPVFAHRAVAYEWPRDDLPGVLVQTLKAVGMDGDNSPG
jgi:hypothetical protein